MKSIRIGLHGCGWVSDEHIRAYMKNPRVEIVALSSRRESSAKAKRDEHNLDCDVEPKFEKLIARKDIDAISICSAAHCHAKETILAAKAKKHILIEKPAALNLKDLKAMRDAVRKAKVRTVASFVLRWNPYLQMVKSLVDDGTLGKVFFVEGDYFHDYGDWYTGYSWSRTKKMGGSPMILGGCHSIDALRWLAGDIAEVMAYATRGHRKDLEWLPSIVGVAKFRNGAIGKIGCSLEMPMPYQFNLLIHGSKGVIRNGKFYSATSFPGQMDFAEVPTILPDSGDVTHHPFEGEINHFVDCILRGKESFVNLENAVVTHEVAFAFDKSAATGKPVKVPLLR